MDKDCIMKKIAFIFWYLFLDTFGVAFNKGLPFNFYILVFQYFIKRKTTFKILIFFIIISSFYIFFKYIIFSHKGFHIDYC